MQLVAYGAQDVYLTGNPQITLFKVVYRRTTNFSVECIELPVDTAKPGQRQTVQILRNGDLATRTYLRVTLPELAPTNGTAYNGNVAWIKRLGHAIMRSVEIQIGGSPIDKHWAVWLDIWYELTHTEEQIRGYNHMIGDVDELTRLQPSVAGGYHMHIPFQFWFCRNYGLALPLIALQYHDVRLYIDFEPLERLVNYTRGTGVSEAPVFQSFQYQSAGILIDYVYLDSEERRRFAQVGHEYLIEQLQFPGEQTPQSSGAQGAVETNQSVTLNFNHPCKEFIWTHRVGAFNGVGGSATGWFLAYSHKNEWLGGWENAVHDAANSLATSMISVATHAPWSAGTVQEVSFGPAADPIVTEVVNGTTWKFTSVNTTNLVDANIQNVWILTNPLVLGTTNLAAGLVDVSVQLDFGDQPFGTAGFPLLSVSVSENTLSLTNLSIPLVTAYVNGGLTDNRLAANTGTDVHVVQLNNYGLRLDGKGNMVIRAVIQLNGHDRFNARDGHYFNYVQPYQHHTHTPPDGINVYSFALHPEQHQPTGTANMSRIDSTKLNYRTQDVLRARVAGMAQLNYLVDTNLYVWATNYNVLRIMSGMGGIAVARFLPPTGRCECASIRLERQNELTTLVLPRQLYCVLLMQVQYNGTSMTVDTGLF
jgi:ribosome modulation factor